MPVLRRFVLTIIVASLTISASGVSSLALTEPCSDSQPIGTDTGACPPTCVTCGCCAQAVEPITVALPGSPDLVVTDVLVREKEEQVGTDPLDTLKQP